MRKHNESERMEKIDKCGAQKQDLQCSKAILKTYLTDFEGNKD